MHLRSLERFDYDSVLFPYNYPLLHDDGYRRDVEQLLEVCASRDVAAQTIKSIARRRWPGDRDDGGARRGPESEERLSWYEPLADDAAIKHAVDFTLGRESTFLITSSDFRKLPAVLRAAETSGDVPPQDEMETDVRSQTMSPIFDGKELERI